ncbi:hypothetical protein AOLI_G00027180 [Acnodon oligacanthus]
MPCRRSDSTPPDRRCGRRCRPFRRTTSHASHHAPLPSHRQEVVPLNGACLCSLMTSNEESTLANPTQSRWSSQPHSHSGTVRSSDALLPTVETSSLITKQNNRTTIASSPSDSAGRRASAKRRLNNNNSSIHQAERI